MVQGRHPIIRRILEKELHPGCHMVLIVAAILTDDNENHLELTDGWSSIPARIDSGLEEQLNLRIFPGVNLPGP